MKEEYFKVDEKSRQATLSSRGLSAILYHLSTWWAVLCCTGLAAVLYLSGSVCCELYCFVQRWH